MYSLTTFVNFLCLLFNVIGSLNSSLSELFQWIDKEANLIQVLQNYILSEDLRLNKLKTYQETLIQHAELYTSVDELASNPLAIYKSIKHLTVDFQKVKENMTENSYNVKKVEEENGSLADIDRTYDEIRSIVQLQRMNNLEVIDMIENGHSAPNSTIKPSLTPEDCFHIGKISFEKYDHEAAVDWLAVCLDKYPDIADKEVPEMLIISHLFLGEISSCRHMIEKQRRKDGYNRVLNDLSVNLSLKIGNVGTLLGASFYSSLISISRFYNLLKHQHLSLIYPPKRWVNQWVNIHEYLQSESIKLCAGDDQEMPHQNLVCRYEHHRSPFLTIAPLKEEIISLIPRIIVVREAIYDSEIEGLQADGYPDLVPGKASSKNGEIYDTHFRIARATFLKNLHSKYIPLRERMTDMTALSLHMWEDIHYVHYVPGGFIRSHSDFMWEDSDSVRTMGQRSGQILFFMNDVTLGGETIFPRLKLKVQPEKGAAIVWPNVQANGREEEFGFHAGCPVVYGEKIIGVQWFRMKNQNNWLTKPEDKATIRDTSFKLDMAPQQT